MVERRLPTCFRRRLNQQQWLQVTVCKLCGNISSRRIDLPYPLPYQPDFERKSCETPHFLHLGLSKMEDTAPQLVAILIRNMLRIRECFPLNFQAPNPSAVEVCPL